MPHLSLCTPVQHGRSIHLPSVLIPPIRGVGDSESRAAPPWARQLKSLSLRMIVLAAGRQEYPFWEYKIERAPQGTRPREQRGSRLLVLVKDIVLRLHGSRVENRLGATQCPLTQSPLRMIRMLASGKLCIVPIKRSLYNFRSYSVQAKAQPRNLRRLR